MGVVEAAALAGRLSKPNETVVPCSALALVSGWATLASPIRAP